MRTIFFFGCLLYIHLSLSAQDLHVYYNAFRDSVYFEQNGKSVLRPNVKKGATVHFHVENYNNYLYGLAVEMQDKDVSTAGGNPTAGLMQRIKGDMNPLGMFFKGGDQSLGGFKNFFPNLGGSDLEEGSGFVKTEAEKEREKQVAQLLLLESEFKKAKDQVFVLESELKGLQEKIQDQITAQRLQVFAVEEINHLRYNPFLEPNQIRQMTAEYMERIFHEKDPNKIDLPQVLKIADAQNEIPKIVKDYRTKTERYASATQQCALTAEGLKRFQFLQSNLDEFKDKAYAFVDAAKIKNKLHQENAEMLENNTQDIPSLDAKTLAVLRSTYIELYNNRFSKTYRQTASGEKLEIKLALEPVDSLRYMGAKTQRMSPITVNVYGGMKVHASVGLNFGQFFKQPQDFYVRDSVIKAGNKDSFLPMVTSFVHFYSPGLKAVTLGGSFGIGFPLGASDNLQAISFFLGPTLVFGRKERILLNFGLMGGKVERLAQGFNIGDEYSSDSNQAPTNALYELGYYFGMSFNLTGGGN